MTDWWAKINEKDKPADRTNLAAMARAQNDLYMVVPDAANHNDNTLSALEEGKLTRAELQRNAANICRFLMDTHAIGRMNGIESVVEVINAPMEDEVQNNGELLHLTLDKQIEIPLEGVDTSKDSSFAFVLEVKKPGPYRIDITAKSDLGELAQIPLTVFIMSTTAAVFTWNGTNGQWVSKSAKVYLAHGNNAMKLYFGQSGLCLKNICITEE